MGPLRRRTWAPRGRTPRLTQRGRMRRKVSVIGALVISPRRRRVRAYFGVRPEGSYDGDAILAFLKQLRRTLRVPVTLVWDRLKAHWATLELKLPPECDVATIRLPCPSVDCLAGWPREGPNETRSAGGAGRPRRATGCSARQLKPERLSMSDPHSLPTR